MTPDEMLAQFRSDVVDLDEPPLWTDAEIKVYINDAQTMFYRLIGGKSDASSFVINVTVGDDWVDLDPRIMKLKGANRTDTGRPVDCLNYEQAMTLGYRWDGRTGPLKAVVFGQELGKARLWPVSNEVVTLELYVDRLPLAPVYPAGGVAAFEVDEMHRLHLLHWVKHLAYLKQDAQTFDRSKSEEFEARFRAYCGQSKREIERQRHSYRAVTYGGI